jgi:hypothetical protein
MRGGRLKGGEQPFTIESSAGISEGAQEVASMGVSDAISADKSDVRG